MLISTAREDFELYQNVIGRAEKYIDLCVYCTDMFQDFMNRNDVYHVEDVKTSDMRRLISEWQSSDRFQRNTINNHVDKIKVFYTFLVDEQIIDEFDNPCRRIKRLKEEKRVITTFNPTEVRNILANCSGQTFFNIRDKLLLLILFDCGLRASEVINLKDDEIYKTCLKVNGKGSRQRMLYLSPVVKRQLTKHRKAREYYFRNKEREPYLFVNQEGKQWRRGNVNKILDKKAKGVKIRKGVRVCPHDCRHYFAQQQLRNGIDTYSLSRLMGHYDTQITSEYLKGLEDEDIVQRGTKTSPVMGLYENR